MEIEAPEKWAGIPALPAAFSGAPLVRPVPAVDPEASSAPSPTASGEETNQETDSMSESSEPGSPKEVPAEPSASSTASSSKELALEAVLDSHTWQATRYKGALHVHFLAAEGSIPRCKQRKGRASAKPLERVSACGDDAKGIGSFTPHTRDHVLQRLFGSYARQRTGRSMHP